MNLQNEYLPADRYGSALALQELLVAACHNSFADGDDYRLLRRELMQDPLTAPFVPSFVEDCENFPSFWQLIHKYDDEEDVRANYVRGGFRHLLMYASCGPIRDHSRPTNKAGEPIRVGWAPLLQQGRRGRGRSRIKGTAPSELAITFDRLSIDVGAASHSTSAWTGRVSRRDQAGIVLSLAPAAIEGLKALLSEQERRLHNAPPEAIECEGLEALRALYEALGKLIEMAEAGRGLERQKGVVASLAQKVFSVAADEAGICVGGLKPLIASLPAAWGTWFVLSLISSSATLATLGPAMVASVTAGYYGVASKRRAKKTE